MEKSFITPGPGAHHLFDIVIFILRLSRLTRSTEQQLGGPVSDGTTQLLVICSRDIT